MSEPVKPLRPASTVMLLRDTPAGVEVFMLRRTLNAAFAGGFFVFPGGVVDEADGHDDLGPLCLGRSDAQASALLDVDAGGLAYWVAAVRECFEEAGVLLAQRHDGVTVSFDDPVVADRFVEHRRAIDDRSLRLADLCRAEGLVLDLGAIGYVSRWITPVGEPRRFDTHFFVAHAPSEQTPLHDDNETIASLWVRPVEALAQHRRGQLQLIAPTIKNLEFLVPFASAAEALEAAGRIGTPAAVRPRLHRQGDLVSVVLPWEPGFDELAFTEDGGDEIRIAAVPVAQLAVDPAGSGSSA